MHIDHVRLLVVNFAECFRFYRDVIGLKVIWGNEADDYGAFALPDQQKPNIALFRRQAMADALGLGNLPVETVAQDRSLLVIGVEDVNATAARWQALGLSFVAEPRDYPGWGMRSAYLRDPDGNLIELCGELPPENWSPELRQAAQQYDRA